MCGIAGVYNQAAPEHVHSMLMTMLHRGPDGHNEIVIGNSALGHTRLAIIDVEGGAQPMHVDDAWITYNGEVYNFCELKNRFLSDQIFSTHSDTEVILRLYRLFGPQAVEYLDGMFALAIIQNQELFLARDPLGIKPLYYGNKDGGLYFASEIKALSRVTDEIKEFPAGTWYHSRMGFHSYYQLHPPMERFQGDESEALPLIRTTLAAAVQKRLIADVPAGISLSGGLDSSIIALLANSQTDHLNSFAVGMEGSEDLAAARKMADLLKTRHHETLYTEDEMLEVLPRVIYHLESFDPALVRSAIPNYILAETASKYVKVILTGEGADELYAGYDYMDQFATDTSLENERLYITSVLHNTNLQRADRVTMAFGLEARVPFLDLQSVSLVFSFPPKWMLHQHDAPKALLRRAFNQELPPEIVNRPKQKFSKGAGSSELFEKLAENEIDDLEFKAEKTRLKKEWNYDLQSKEGLYYYKFLNETYRDAWIFPTMGSSRSL